MEKTFTRNIVLSVLISVNAVLFWKPAGAALYTFSGNANSNGIYGPIQKCDDKWIGQAMIYPSSGFNGGAGFGSITTVGFYLVGSGSSLNIPFKIYLKSVGATTTLSGTPTWATALSGASLAFTGSTPTSFSAGNWYDVTLTTPFNWSSGNLEVLVECDWGQVTGCGTSPVWAYNTAANTDQEWNNGTSAAALQTTAGMPVDQYRPDIRLNVSALIPPPTISGFNPSNGCTASGTSVVITGTNFTGVTSVTFNGTSAAYTVDNVNQITATLPSNATTGTISVTTGAGTATSSSSFTVNITPVATATPSVQSICSGDVANIGLSSNVGGTSYSWSRNTPGGVSGTMPTTGTTDPNGTLVNSNTTAATVTFTITPSTASCTGTAVLASIVVQPVPATPGSISGAVTVCSGSSNNYSIAGVSGATSYTWTLPNGWSGSSTSTSISATAGSSGGNISVTANNSCGSSSAQTLSVTVQTPPATPGSISGTTSICSGSSNTYSIATVSGAISYTWALPNGWTGSSTTESINATSSSNSGSISVTANNNCGSSSAQTLSVIVSSAPSMPGTISGPVSVCEGGSNIYSIASVSGATSYTWALPNGWTGSSTTESINTTSSSNGGTISVMANNNCGSSSAQTLSVTVSSAPSMPGTISGPASVCEGNSNTYSITSVSGATSYIWTLPNGWSGTSTTTSINATAGASGGNITVYAENFCGSSTMQVFTVTVEIVPAMPGTISGPDNLCAGDAGTYSVATVSGATIYTWTLPNGWTGSSTTENINATSSSAGGTVIVTAGNNCGTSTVQSKSVTVNPVPTSAFTLTSPVCEGANSTITYTGTGTANATYTWDFDGGTIVSGSGQGPFMVYWQTAGTKNITLGTSENGCSSNGNSTVEVTVCTGIHNAAENIIEVYPNPFTNELIVNAIEEGVAVLDNILGETVGTYLLSGKAIRINTSGLAEGVYLLNIMRNGEPRAVKRIVKAG